MSYHEKIIYFLIFTFHHGFVYIWIVSLQTIFILNRLTGGKGKPRACPCHSGLTGPILRTEPFIKHFFGQGVVSSTPPRRDLYLLYGIQAKLATQERASIVNSGLSFLLSAGTLANLLSLSFEASFITNNDRFEPIPIRSTLYLLAQKHYNWLQ